MLTKCVDEVIKSTMKERVGYIDSLKGLAILLMVMGHVIANQFPSYRVALDDEPRLTMLVWRIIYSFHMPLLMFCSGLVSLHMKDFSWKGIGLVVWKRMYTLLLPFVCSGFLLHVVIHSDTFGLWYLWLLFQFIVVVLLIDGLCMLLPKYGKTFSTIAIIAFALAVHIWYRKFYYLERLPLIDVGHWSLFPYFCMGVICARYDLCNRWFSKNWVFTCALVLFAFLTYWLTVQGCHIPRQSITGCLLPISSIVALVYLFKVGLEKSASRGVLGLQNIGRHSMEVYILHFLFLVRIHSIGDFVLCQANTDGGGRTIFFVQICSSFACAIIIIILCYVTMNVVNKSKILSLLLLGRKSTM